MVRRLPIRMGIVGSPSIQSFLGFGWIQPMEDRSSLFFRGMRLRENPLLQTGMRLFFSFSLSFRSKKKSLETGFHFKANLWGDLFHSEVSIHEFPCCLPLEDSSPPLVWIWAIIELVASLAFSLVWPLRLVPFVQQSE